MHNGTKTLSITIKWVCVPGVKGKGMRGGWGWSLCVPNFQGDAKIQCGTPKAKDGVSGGVSHSGK